MLQQIEVTAAPSLVETAASNFSTTIGGSTVEEIPLQGRDLQQLVFLFPGVNSTAGPPGSNFGFDSSYGSFPDPTHALGSDLSVNGGQGGANSWYLDGNLNLSGLLENMAVDPSPDAVSEFQVIGEAFSAEYGRTGGAAFNVVLKSGTNKLHGDAYEYVRNDATNARNPFTSIDSQGNIIKSRQLRFNDFGGTLACPCFQKIDAHASLAAHDVRRIHSETPQLADRGIGNGILFGKCRHKRGGQTPTGKRDCDVCFASAEGGLKARRLQEALKARRCQAQHQFTECHRSHGRSAFCDSPMCFVNHSESGNVPPVASFGCFANQ
jgi:hypothetical protein